MKNDDTLTPAPARCSQSRLTTAIGIAMIAVSLAGLVHHWMGLEWGLEDQAFYAFVGGLSSWRLVK
jgi:hypothetical protein